MNSVHQESNKSQERNRRTNFLIIGSALCFGLYMLGKYHIVSGIEGKILVPRLSFGYDQAFGSVSECTGADFSIVMAKSGKLCGALQAQGIISSNEEMELMRQIKIDKEIKRQMEQMREY